MPAPHAFCWTKQIWRVDDFRFIGNFLSFNLHQKPFDSSHTGTIEQIAYNWNQFYALFAIIYPFTVVQTSSIEPNPSPQPVIDIIFFAHHSKKGIVRMNVHSSEPFSVDVYAICSDNLWLWKVWIEFCTQWHTIYYFRKCSSFTLTSYTLSLLRWNWDTILGVSSSSNTLNSFWNWSFKRIA